MPGPRAALPGAVRALPRPWSAPGSPRAPLGAAVAGRGYRRSPRSVRVTPRRNVCAVCLEPRPVLGWFASCHRHGLNSGTGPCSPEERHCFYYVQGVGIFFLNSVAISDTPGRWKFQLPVCFLHLSISEVTWLSCGMRNNSADQVFFQAPEIT